MAVELFKRDNASRITSQLFPIDRFKAHLDQGWALNPDDLMVDADFEVPDFGANQQQESEDQIRQRAKDAGIINWWNKSLDKILEELNGMQAEG